MNIQWFPGHMAKSMRMIEESLSSVDAVIYVLDARAPKSCLNPAFDKLLGNKKKIYALNKSDISDPAVNRQWQEYFVSKGDACVTVCGTNKGLLNAIVRELNAALSDKIEKYKNKGVKISLRAMVIGVPNSGKSTIINTLCGSKRAETGDKPGVTRGKQWVRLENGIELLDTPGTLWNAFADQQAARHLAYIGSIKEEVLDIMEISLCLIGELKALYPKYLAERYGLSDISKTPSEILDDICRGRGFLKSGGLDTERGSRAVLDDFKKARLGRISLEKPDA